MSCSVVWFWPEMLTEVEDDDDQCKVNQEEYEEEMEVSIFSLSLYLKGFVKPGVPYFPASYMSKEGCRTGIFKAYFDAVIVGLKKNDVFRLSLLMYCVALGFLRKISRKI